MNYGCLPPKYDARDYKLSASASTTKKFPDEYIVSRLVAVKNQGAVSSCVAHATSSILEFHSVPHRRLSTNFIYGIQNYEFNRDSKGMYLRDACKIALKYGDMLETDCPGNNEVPECYPLAEAAIEDEAKSMKAIEYCISSYFTCDNNDDIKYAIYKYGPVLASLKWYDTFHTNEEGVLEGEDTGDYGYHAVMVYGYNSEGFLCQNSWGKDWGNKGRFILPYSIKFSEAKGLVDWTQEGDLKKPKTNAVLNILYKAFNAVVNFFNKIFKK